MAGLNPSMTNGRLSASANSSTLIRADVCRLGDLRPARDLAAGPGVELLRGVALGVDAEAAGVLGELGRGDHRADVGRKLLQHRRRNAGGSVHRVDGGDAEARIAFGERGRLRRVTKPLGAGAGDQ